MLALAIALDALVAIGLLVVTRAGASETWPFFALAFGTGVATALGAPAGRALTPSLVPREILVRAFAQRSIAFQLSVIGGPALGGLLFAVQPELVYAVSAAFSLVALLAVLAMRSRARRRRSRLARPGERARRVRLVRRTPVLLGAISLDLFAVLFGGAVALFPCSRRTCSRWGRPAWASSGRLPRWGHCARPRALPASARRHAGRTLLTVVAVYGATMIVFGLSETCGCRSSRSRRAARSTW